MKIIFYISILILFTFQHQVQAQIVNIPDSTFKSFLVNDTNININGDTEIQVSEAQAFSGSIIVYGASLTDLTGIEAFTAITRVECLYTSLDSIDLSNNTALTYILLANNPLTSVKLNNPNLIELLCYDNLLTSLDLSLCPQLTTVNCKNNNLTTLVLTPSLGDLACYNNQLTSLDLTNTPNLFSLRCQTNQLTSLNNLSNLYTLSCYNNQLTSLDLSNNTVLYRLYCSHNQLTALDVSSSTQLYELHCSDNQLTLLNVQTGTNTSMITFLATGNPNLTCIQADSTNIPFWNTFIPSGAYLSMDCNYPTSTTNIVDNNEANFMSVYPTPTLGILNITFNELIPNPHVTITDLTGRQLFSKKFASEQQIELNLDIPNGLYLLTVSSEDKRKTTLIQKQ